MKRLKFLAIFAGVVVDIVSSIIFGTLLAIAIGVYLTSHGTPANQLGPKVAELRVQSVVIHLADLGMGGCGALVGGFVTGWLSRTNRVFNGFVEGIISSVIGAVFLLLGKDPLTFDAIAVACTIVPAGAGAWIASLIFGRGTTAKNEASLPQ